MVAGRADDSWQTRAACRGPGADAFFPPTQLERKEDRLARERSAKAICRSCPVRPACLEYAIAIREPHGVWGGLSETERKQLLDQRVG